MVKTLGRRGWLKKLATGTVSIAGLSGATGSVAAQSSADKNKQLHVALRNDLSTFSDVWEMNAERKLNQWSQSLRAQALDSVNPTPSGFLDVFPGSAGDLKDLAEQMKVTGDIAQSTNWVNARRKYRVEWEKIDGYDQTLQKQYYTELGYGVGNDLVNGTPQQPGHPYLAIYLSPIRGLPEAYHGEIGYQTLEARGKYAHQVLEQQLLDQVPQGNEYEQALYSNLQALQKLSKSVENLATRHA